jgi:hypothetical protein
VSSEPFAIEMIEEETSTIMEKVNQARLFLGQKNYIAADEILDEVMGENISCLGQKELNNLLRIRVSCLCALVCKYCRLVTLYSVNIQAGDSVNKVH